MYEKVTGQAAAQYAQGANQPIRPDGVLRSKTRALQEQLNAMRVQRDRMFSSCERLLLPRPEPAHAGRVGEQAGLSNNSLEAELDGLLGTAHELLASLSEIADRLESAV